MGLGGEAACQRPLSTADSIEGGDQGRVVQGMLAMTHSPRQPSNLHWSVDADGSVIHTYSKNQIAAALREVRRAEIPSDTPTPSTDGQMNEPDTHRPSGSGQAFGDDAMNVGRQGKEVPGQISGECPVSREFLKIVCRVGRAHGLIVRDIKTKMKVLAAVLVACHARFDPGAHLAFSRFLFVWGSDSEYARCIKRKQAARAFAREDGDAWRSYAMEEAARRAEDERRVLQFVLQCEADIARRKAEEAKKRAARDERRKAEERVRYLVKMMMRETTKQQAESARGMASQAEARTTERSKGGSVWEALAHESAEQQASSVASQTVVNGGVAKGSEEPKGSAEAPSADGSLSMMQRQAAPHTPRALASASRKGATPGPPNPYRSNGELRVYPTREDLQACWAALFDGRAIECMK
ncbi:hypothetical protein EV121DRAFT_282528 [Schizophyllum commune]